MVGEENVALGVALTIARGRDRLEGLLAASEKAAERSRGLLTKFGEGGGTSLHAGC